MVVKTLSDLKEFCNANGIDPLELLWDASERNQRLLDQAIIKIRSLSTEDKSIIDIKNELIEEIKDVQDIKE